MADTTALDEDVRVEQEELERTPVGHPDRPDCLGDLAISLWNRYETTHDRADLDRIIELEREALELTPPSHSDRALRAGNLAVSLRSRYHLTRVVGDLDRAVELGQEAHQLTLSMHPDGARWSGNLANALRDRYILTRVVGDLDRAIELYQEAHQLTPSTHPDRGLRSGNLATVLWDRYLLTRVVGDLDRIIELEREGLELTPPSHFDRALRAGNLASSLGERYRLTRDVGDLDRAIVLQEEAVRLTPSSHPRHSGWAGNLLLSLSERYSLTKLRSDLKLALEAGQQAIQDGPIADYNRSYLLQRVSNILQQVETQPSFFPIIIFGATLNTVTDVHQKRIDLLREAAYHPVSDEHDRLSAARDWYTISDNDSSTLEAAKCIFDLLEGAVGHARSLEGQYTRLTSQSAGRGAEGFVSDAAALALNTGDIPLAVSMLEQGRSVIFGQLGRFRVAIDDVETVAPDLAAEFTNVSADLNRILGASDGNDVSGRDGRSQDRGLLYSRAQTRWTKVVDAIRAQPGLESFLRRPTFPQLQQAAQEGPVIVVNISKCRSDAIIIFHQTNPILVPLPEAPPEEVNVLVKRLGSRPAKLHDNDLVPILRDIWDMIGRPIARALRQQSYRRGRIWWCPTGVASQLPLHAAGPYMADKRSFHHMYTQSYTPTLAALLRARQLKIAGPSNRNPVKSLLLVGLPEVDETKQDVAESSDDPKPEQVKLPKVVDEIQAIERSAPHATALMLDKATCEAVLDRISQHSWVHFACHGHHHPEQPFLSHFSMWDGPLSLLDLVRMDLPNAELAVLSACHSAKISKQLPDEVLNPAAGMLFAGFKSVIGTMWALDDVLGSELSGEFYERMLGGPEGPKEYTEAAQALADSLRALRNKKARMDLAQWVNVIHEGA